jgi:hypothetical protein
MKRFLVLPLVVLSTLGAGVLTAAAPIKLSVFLPTAIPVVRKMLDLGDLRPGELHYDLGSGDGRIVLMAASRYRARSVGFEIDPELILESRAHIERLGLQDRACIEQKDLLSADLSLPDLITMFLTPEALAEVQPLLERQVKRGARIVSYKFPLEGWQPEETITWEDPRPEIPLHVIYLYRR